MGGGYGTLRHQKNDERTVVLTIGNEKTFKPPVIFLEAAPGLGVGSKILCRDQFPSKFSGDTMYKWREAVITEIDQPLAMKVHFKGWGNKHDIYVNIEKEWTKISPPDLLPESQRASGEPLSNDQESKVKKFLFNEVVNSSDDNIERININFQVGQKVFIIMFS